jgi:hypothetical protein
MKNSKNFAVAAKKAVEGKVAPVRTDFVIQQYGVHTPEVVQKAVDLAAQIDKARDLDNLLNAISSTPSVYPKFLGVMLKGKASGKSALASMQAFFTSKGG